MHISKPIINFVFGPINSGKTTLCHFLNNHPLNIKRTGLTYTIETAKPDDRCKIIKNGSSPGTSIPIYYDHYCDMPGFNDSREESNINTLLLSYIELQNFPSARLVLVFEESFVTENNGRKFLDLSNNFIDTFGLNENDYTSLVLVLTKSSGDYLSFSELFNRAFAGKFNFIIEYIKNSKILVSAFEKPKERDNKYELNEGNKESFTDIDSRFQSINCGRIRGNILVKLESLLLKIKNSINNSGIFFTSNSDEKNFRSSNILCIDKDISVFSESLLIDSPYIIILPENPSARINIKAVGDSPTIEIKTGNIINSEKLVVSTSKFGIDYPDPTKASFNTNHNFFRLESICVNGSWTEYASHNNKFLDLIVYLHPEVGKIIIDPKFRIKTNQVDIKLKLFVNECMRTKNGIIERFPSIKSHMDLNEYLEVCNKTSIPVKIKEALETYVLRLPSIFQLFMEGDKISKFAFDSEKKDVKRIKNVLLERYLRLVSDFKNGKSGYQHSELTLEALERFKEFCAANLKSYSGEDSLSQPSLRKDLKTFFKRCKVSKGHLLNFYSFYDLLSTTEDKDILFKIQLSGDQSIYANYLSSINRQLTANLLSAGDLENNEFNIKNGVFAASGFTLVIGAGAATTVRLMIARGAANAGIRAGLGLTSLVTSAIGLGLIAAELGINIVCALVKSGYLSGEYRPDLLDLLFVEII